MQNSTVFKWQKLLLMACLQFLALSAFSQIRIQGKITDPDGQGIPGISVIVRNTTYGTSTNATGDYALDANLRQGTYTVSFSGVGFKTIDQPLRVTTDNSYTLNAALGLDALGLDEVVVTGTLGRTTRREIGNAISTVSAKQLQNTGSANLSAM
ncbi:MAG: carboxypeptidase-like regulatory domain-containing protein, partial [Chitinophagaceae bacterium]